ncbi:MAG: DUF4329 domain-containing protein [Armatimonadetes bacterium]|nr:DUF4329 domain-containing protein [Armatimonadota bacterium]
MADNQNPATPSTPLRNSDQVLTDASLQNVVPEVVIEGPRVGAAYDSADEAALAALVLIEPVSRKEMREYAGWIYFNINTRKYYFTKARRGSADNSDAGQPPAGSVPIGVYHTHGGRPAGKAVATDEQFSETDKFKAIAKAQLAFLATPGGQFLRFTPKLLLPEDEQAANPVGRVSSLLVDQ